MTGVLTQGTTGAVTQHGEKPCKVKAKTEVWQPYITKNVTPQARGDMALILSGPSQIFGVTPGE